MKTILRKLLSPFFKKEKRGHSFRKVLEAKKIRDEQASRDIKKVYVYKKKGSFESRDWVVR